MAEARFDGRDIKACVFDAYGTLLDFNSAARESGASLGDKTERLAEIWRWKQLQYTWLRSLMGVHADFWQVTGEALDYAMAALDIEDPLLRAQLMQQYLTVEAYPDAAETLRALKDAGIKTAILSNGSPTMLLSAVKSASLHGVLNAVLSVESVGVFKPHPSVYQLAVDQLKTPASAIAFLSANAWDAHAAAAFGFCVAWINRDGQPRERIPAMPHAELRSLSELPALLGL